MKVTSLRALFKFMALPGAIIVVSLVVDAVFNSSRTFVALTWLAIVYLLVLLLLLLLPPAHGETAVIQTPESEPMSYHFPPENRQ